MHWTLMFILIENLRKIMQWLCIFERLDFYLNSEMSLLMLWSNCCMLHLHISYCYSLLIICDSSLYVDSENAMILSISACYIWILIFVWCDWLACLVLQVCIAMLSIYYYRLAIPMTIDLTSCCCLGIVISSYYVNFHKSLKAIFKMPY